MLLYHLPFDAGCRTVRLCLAEKGLEFALRIERTWMRDRDFLALNPAGEVPVLTGAEAAQADRNARVQGESLTICGARAICEYLDEVRDSGQLIGDNAAMRAEVRRLVDWFDGRFAREVGSNLVYEKITKRLSQGSPPDSLAIRAGRRNIHIHLQYIEFLTQDRNWLAGRRLSLADLAAAAHISCVDYMGDIPWEGYSGAKDWYAKMKSRPSFKPLLGDRMPGMSPASHYENPDF